MAHSNTEDSDDDQAQAQTLNKLIAMRGGQRAWVTKKIRTANTMFLILKDSPLEDEMRQDLVILKETLSKRLKQLDEMNMKVQELLPVTDIENDIAECYDREEEITSIIQKISKLQVDKERSSEKEGDDTLKEKHYATWETGPASPKSSARPADRPTCFQIKAQTPRPSEPILIPKLRIQFADFPYLHYSIDQRLFT